MAERKKAIIIGAGIAGLAAAIRLARDYDVTVTEAGPVPGGKLSVLTSKGFRYDTGPSLFTLPALVDELFLLHKRNPRGYYNYKRLDNICNYFFNDETRISAWADINRFAEELENKTGEPAINVVKYLKSSQRKYRLTEGLLLKNSLHKISTWFSPGALKGYLNLGKLDIFRSLDAVHTDAFDTYKVRQIFNRYATFNGSDPYQAPGMHSLIPHLEHTTGAFSPVGGMYAIVEALFRLAQEIGVNFCFCHKVEQIIQTKGKVSGIITDKGIFQADLVVSNCDIYYTYNKLLPDVKKPEKILSQERSSSALVFYWNVHRTFPELDVHNIFFSRNYKDEFNRIFNQNSVSDDPTVYVHISSKVNPEDAPKGCENWFVMINVPADKGQDWTKIKNEARENILNRISTCLKTDLRKYIKGEESLDPIKIEKRTSSFQGALYGNSSNRKYAAFLRHPNFTSTVKNLYFCGGSVHPGGGIPLCLNSAKIVSDLISRS